MNKARAGTILITCDKVVSRIYLLFADNPGRGIVHHIGLVALVQKSKSYCEEYEENKQELKRRDKTFRLGIQSA